MTNGAFGVALITKCFVGATATAVPRNCAGSFESGPANTMSVSTLVVVNACGLTTRSVCSPAARRGSGTDTVVNASQEPVDGTCRTIGLRPSTSRCRLRSLFQGKCASNEGPAYE